jgi:hypothetical protein
MPQAISHQQTNSQTSSRLRDAIVALVPAVLLTLFVAQCLWFIRTQSLTYDEPVHIAEGLKAWRTGQFEEYNDHPPLMRLICTLPLVVTEKARKWQVQVERLPVGFGVPRIESDPVSLAWRTRQVNMALGLILGIVLWRQAAKLFSLAAANFVLALFAFSPSLIAHFSLATTDGAATLLIFVTALAILCWKEAPTWKNTLTSAVVLGALLLAKFSTVPIFVLAIFWMLTLVRGRFTLHPLWWNWAKTIFAVLVACLVVWAGYFFHVSQLTIHNGTLIASHPHWTTPLIKSTSSKLEISIPVPAGEFIAGLRDVALHNAHGQRAFFLGQVSPTGGWKAYYPTVVLLKWPLVVLALSCAGAILVAWKKVAVTGFWILVSFPGLYFGLAIFSHFNIGERHILPLYPFALLFAAAAWQKFSNFRFAKVALLALLAVNAADVLRYAPDYLSYFNIFVRPDASYRLLADSNLDWGQGLLALRDYEREHPNERLSLAYFGSVDPAVYGIQARALGETDRTTGTVVVSATDLAGEYLKDPNAYHWLLGHQRIAALNHSLYVFRVAP